MGHRLRGERVEAHHDAPFSFVTDGAGAAVARAREPAGDRVVGVTGGTIARQSLDLGLLGDPTVRVRGERVVHLVFPVPR